MTCPTCHQRFVWEKSPYRPFCSERCRLLDLEAWMKERYRVPVDPESDDIQDAISEESYHSTNGSDRNGRG